MWPRVVELMLGAWLLVSPFVFRETAGAGEYVVNAVACGATIMIASLVSFWSRARKAHVLTLMTAVWLVAHGYVSGIRPGPAAAQNEITVGLLLLLFAILPSEANQPPREWRAWAARTSSPPPQQRR